MPSVALFYLLSQKMTWVFETLKGNVSRDLPNQFFPLWMGPLSKPEILIVDRSATGSYNVHFRVGYSGLS